MEDDLAKASQAVEDARKATLEVAGPSAAVHQTAWDAHMVLWLSGGLFLYALVLFACVTYLLAKGQQAWTLIRLFGILSILMLSVFILIAGYDEKQLLPIIGLFGSIIGYLLGKSSDADQGTGNPPGSSAG